MRFTRDELCILQQALGLREAVIINSNDLFIQNRTTTNHIESVRKLRKRVIDEIRAMDHNHKAQPDEEGWIG